MARQVRTEGVRGILAGVDRLEVWLHVSLVALTIASALRYVEGHGTGDDAPWVLGCAGLLLALYAARRPLTRAGGVRPAAWCLLLVATWLVLDLLAPSFGWCAVPLSFVALRVLPFAAAVAVVCAMTLTVVLTWTRMVGEIDLTVVLGPAAVAVLAVLSYRALERQAALRQELVEELEEAQSDLALAQHDAGALAERARLSREIHDSVAQGLSSINLLLQAAQQDWSARPAAAREHVEQAARTARDELVEVRRMVRDLAPEELSADPHGVALAAALRRTAERVETEGGPHVEVRVHGEPVPLQAALATAVLRTARGALANVVEHAAATVATVTLTYQGDVVAVDVRDDGRGFDPEQPRSAPGRGRGLVGLRQRAARFGGRLVVESAVGEGTTLAAMFPLSEDGEEDTAW